MEHHMTTTDLPVIGWRWAMLRDGATGLCSPFTATPCPPAPRIKARPCAKCGTKRPPAPDCTCGIYAYRHVVNALAAMRSCHSWGTDRLPYQRADVLHRHAPAALVQAGYEDVRPPFFVGARLKLRGVIECDDSHPEYTQPGHAGLVVRARSAVVMGGFIFEDRWHTPGDLRRAADMLSTLYGVPGAVGEPSYDEADWTVALPTEDMRKTARWFGLLRPGASALSDASEVEPWRLHPQFRTPVTAPSDSTTLTA
jgi:hypothetical protein